MATALPEPLDLYHHLSRTTQRRQASFVKGFYKYFLIPGIGQLAGGLPCNDYFPFDDLEAKVALPNRFKPRPNQPVKPPVNDLASTSLKHESPPAGRIVVPADSGVPDPRRKIDTSVALQYMTAEGFPPLVDWVRHFTKNVLHANVPYKDGPELILTNGSTDGFAKVLECFNNPWTDGRDPIDEKEGMLCEEHAYMGAIQSAAPRGITIAPVRVDAQGMTVDGKGGLRDVLENWDFSKGRRPHLMYTVTIGQNPTSGTLGIARRKEIYALCTKYDILIIEDDPYWYLQYPSSNPTPYHLPPGAKSSGYDFIDSLVPSYLSIDVQGRVIRLDTFSKTVAPGCRLGWLTAQPKIIERITRITESTSAHPSGFVQSMIAELIMGPQSANDPGHGGAKDGNGWKTDGWVRWLEGLRGNYERRMTTMCDVLDQGKQLVKSGRRNSLDANTEGEEWSVIETTPVFDFVRPLAGMFVWIRFNFETHPLFKKVPGPRLSKALWVLWTMDPWKVLAAPGTIFSPTLEVQESIGWYYFRLCFCHVEEETLVPLSKSFYEGAHAFWRIKSVQKIDEIMKDEDGNGALSMLDGRVDNGATSLVGFGC